MLFFLKNLLQCRKYILAFFIIISFVILLILISFSNKELQLNVVFLKNNYINKSNFVEEYTDEKLFTESFEQITKSQKKFQKLSLSLQKAYEKQQKELLRSLKRMNNMEFIISYNNHVSFHFFYCFSNFEDKIQKILEMCKKLFFFIVKKVLTKLK